MKNIFNFKNFVKIALIGGLITTIILGYGIYRDVKLEYKVALSEVEKYESMMTNKTSELRKLEKKEIEIEDNLYYEIVDFRHNTDDKIFKYIYDERYPSCDYYKTNRRESFVIIYAMLEICPVLKKDEEISTFVREIDNTLEEMEFSVYEFNQYLDEYNKWVKTVNNTSYVKHWGGDKIKENMYDYAIIE